MAMPEDITIDDHNSSRRLEAAQNALATVRMMLKRPLSRPEAEALFYEGYEDAIDLIEAQITKAIAAYDRIYEDAP
jgi:hypothetical protein